jgi:hypothetical protein
MTNGNHPPDDPCDECAKKRQGKLPVVEGQFPNCSWNNCTHNHSDGNRRDLPTCYTNSDEHASECPDHGKAHMPSDGLNAAGDGQQNPTYRSAKYTGNQAGNQSSALHERTLSIEIAAV